MTIVLSHSCHHSLLVILPSLYLRRQSNILAELLTEQEEFWFPLIVKMKGINPMQRERFRRDLREIELGFVEHAQVHLTARVGAKLFMGDVEWRHPIDTLITPAQNLVEEETHRVIAAMDIGFGGNELVPEVAVAKAPFERRQWQFIEHAKGHRGHIKQCAACTEIADKEGARQNRGLDIIALLKAMPFARILDEKCIHLHIGQACAETFGQYHAGVGPVELDDAQTFVKVII